MNRISLECPICHEMLAAELVPIVGVCGHSLCHGCGTKVDRCPICQAEEAFKSGTSNFQLIELMNEHEKTTCALISDNSMLTAENEELERKLVEHMEHITAMEEELRGKNTELQGKAAEMDEKEEQLMERDREMDERQEKINEMQRAIDEYKARYAGPFCADCALPMKEPMTIICVSCFPEEFVAMTEDGTMEIGNFEEAESRLICCACKNYGVHSTHDTKLYHNLKVTQNVKRLKNELMTCLDDSVCNVIPIAGIEENSNRLKELVMEQCQSLSDCLSWKAFEEEEAKLRGVVEEAAALHKEFIDGQKKFSEGIASLNMTL